MCLPTCEFSQARYFSNTACGCNCCAKKIKKSILGPAYTIKHLLGTILAESVSALAPYFYIWQCEEVCTLHFNDRDVPSAWFDALHGA